MVSVSASASVLLSTSDALSLSSMLVGRTSPIERGCDCARDNDCGGVHDRRLAG